MRKIREALRLKAEGLSMRKIATSLDVALNVSVKKQASRSLHFSTSLKPLVIKKLRGDTLESLSWLYEELPESASFSK